MPAISLVVCLYRDRFLLRRLLSAAEGLYDEVIVVHDGPEETTSEDTIAAELSSNPDARFYVRPRSYQQEPHWPFAWEQARHDWILRLDADELPSPEMKVWLADFRAAPEPPTSIDGYTCIWPLWDGLRIVTRAWPAGRIFLFHKQRVRFFGMVEQVPLPDTAYEPLPLVLEHRPERKSYGLRNLLWRKQAYSWRRVIAQSLLASPRDLPAWRWHTDEWPLVWEEIRRQPLRVGVSRLVVWPLRTARDLWRSERRIIWGAFLFSGLHHFLIGVELWRIRRFKPRP